MGDGKERDRVPLRGLVNATNTFYARCALSPQTEDGGKRTIYPMFSDETR